MILKKLKSRVYLGEVELKGECFKGQHEPIVSKDLWERVNNLLRKQAPTRRNPKQPKQRIFLLQSLLQCGWCNSFMSTKYSTGGNGRRHYYYQCTKNAHGGNDACKMKYVPADKLEKIVLNKIRLLSTDKEFLNQVILTANESSSGKLSGLVDQKKDQENKLLSIKEQIGNIVNAIAGNQIKNPKSISEKLAELEEQRTQFEKTINDLGFQIDEEKRKIFSAEIMHKSLTKFSQVYDKSDLIPEKVKDLLTNFVQFVTFSPQEIQIALFNRPTEKGLLVNHSDIGAPECIEWLPREDSNLGPSG